MRKYLSLLLGFGALLAVGAPGIAGAAGGEGPVTILIPANGLEVNAGVSPKALSTSEPTPVSLYISGETSEIYGGHPPALRELTMEFDQAIMIDTEGIPPCRRRLLRETTETAAALEACRPSLIGEGKAVVQVARPEGDVVNLHSRLLVFEGGERDGKTTLLVHAYFPDPVGSAIVVPVKIARHRSGPFGSRAIARIPRIAEGFGSIVDFGIRTFESVEVGGARLHPLLAICPTGRLRVLNAGKFEDGSTSQTEVVRACTERD